MILSFLILESFFILLFLLWGGLSLAFFYGLCVTIGFFAGYWAVLLMAVTERYGTNIRATVATTAPNFVRGSSIILTLAFKFLSPSLGTLQAAAWIGFATMALAFWSYANLEETYGKNLDYVEPV